MVIKTTYIKRILFLKYYKGYPRLNLYSSLIPKRKDQSMNCHEISLIIQLLLKAISIKVNFEIDSCFSSNKKIFVWKLFYCKTFCAQWWQSQMEPTSTFVFFPWTWLRPLHDHLWCLSWMYRQTDHQNKSPFLNLGEIFSDYLATFI